MNFTVFTNSIGLKLALIQPGTFVMGSPSSEAERKDEEFAHEVRISKPFYLGTHEVTQDEYEKVMGANPSHFSATGSGRDRVMGEDMRRFPVECVFWEEAAEFCRRLSELPEEKRSGRRYRLPTEAEWEYACRAGTTTVFHYGNSLSSTQANFGGESPYGGAARGPQLMRTTAVGSYVPNAFGLYDMHGNVWEWCADWCGDDYYRTSPSTDPQGPGSGTFRALRGGSWASSGTNCRAARRSARRSPCPLETRKTFYDVGFRILRDA